MIRLLSYLVNFISGQSFVLPLMVQVGEMARLVVNSISLISAYTLFAVDCETIFAATLVYLLFNWILVEYYLRNAENKLICCSIRPSGSSKQSCVRTILFFVSF